jgi:hypothetical protein
MILSGTEEIAVVSEFLLIFLRIELVPKMARVESSSR